MPATEKKIEDLQHALSYHTWPGAVRPQTADPSNENPRHVFVAISA